MDPGIDEAWQHATTALERAIKFGSTGTGESDLPVVVPALEYSCAIVAWPADDPLSCLIEVVAIDQPSFQASANGSARYHCISQSISRLAVGRCLRAGLSGLLAIADTMLKGAVVKQYTAGTLHGALCSAQRKGYIIETTGM